MLKIERHPQTREIIIRDDETGNILLNADGFSYFQTMEEARAAIAKATGEECSFA